MNWSTALNSEKNQIGHHDGAGNYMISPANSQYPGYDYDNRMTRYVGQQGAQQILGMHMYAPDGKRIASQRMGDTYREHTLWVGNTRIATGTKEYVYLAGRRLQPQANGMFALEAADRLGSAVQHLPYGEELTGTANDRTKFATYWRDGSTGLDYADQRYYGPGTGRFLTADPYLASGGVTNPSSWNRYAYVEGDPVNHTDTEGLFLSVADLVQQTKARATPRLDTATCSYGGMTYPAWMMICRVMPLLIGPDVSSPQTSDDVERLVNLSPADVLMRELPMTVQYAASLLSKPECGSLFTGENPAAVLTTMMGTIGRDGLLTGSHINFRNLAGDRVAQLSVGGSATPASGGNGFNGHTWANAVIEVDIESWRGMSGLEQARTLIHELGHMYQLVTGLGSSAFEYDVDANGRPDAAIGARNRARELQCW